MLRGPDEHEVFVKEVLDEVVNVLLIEPSEASKISPLFVDVLLIELRLCLSEKQRKGPVKASLQLPATTRCR